MKDNEKVKFTKRDRVLRAWENSMELVRDFEKYSKEIENDNQLSEMFDKFAEDEAIHAAEFRKVLHQYQ